MQKKKQHKI